MLIYNKMEPKLLSIILFLILYISIVQIKPSFIYDHKINTLRPFGIGYKNTTVVSLWLVSILLAILSYFCVIYYMNSQNMWY
jgi:hypothetical protein